MSKIDRLKDADPVIDKYQIDSEKHVRAARSHINNKENAAQCDAEDLKTIRSRIKEAAGTHEIEIGHEA